MGEMRHCDDWLCKDVLQDDCWKACEAIRKLVWVQRQAGREACCT